MRATPRAEAGLGVVAVGDGDLLGARREVGPRGEVAATVGDVEALAGGGITVFEGGVGAAPGAAQVAAVMVGDMAALLLGASRLAAETGAAYGYDPKDPAEKIFVAGVRRNLQRDLDAWSQFLKWMMNLLLRWRRKHGLGECPG